jgi:hypothetical protein
LDDRLQRPYRRFQHGRCCGIESASRRAMIASTTTKAKEREQWRARILRALAELDTDPRSLDRIRPNEDHEAASSSTRDDV